MEWKLKDVQCRVADSKTRNQIDLSPVLVSVSWDEFLFDQPGKCTFEYLFEGLKTPFQEGSHVVISLGASVVFDGYVFKRDISNKDTVKVTAFDRLRYLNNKDSIVFEGVTATEVFVRICELQGIPYKVSASTKYKLAPVLHDNKSLCSMLSKAIDETLINTGKLLMVRDSHGKLELTDVAKLKTPYVFSDDSLLKGFNFESSIDSNTYNYVKLVQEDKKKKVRNVYVVKDSKNISRWGRLQFFEKVDANMNEAQIKERAHQMLKLYNRRTRSLKVECLGNPTIRAGSGIAISIEKLSSEGFASLKYLFVSKVSHKVSRKGYTMNLTLEVV